MNQTVRRLRLEREKRAALSIILARIETWCWVIAAILIIILACSGCASVRPSWQGLYIGTEMVAPFNNPVANPDAEATAIIGIGTKSSVQISVWGNQDAQGFRIAIERRVF